MDTDNLEEFRERLLREENVQHMIRVRAYEIYRMRGAQPGAAAGDWFQAESEVLAFILAHESQGADDKSSGGTTVTLASEAKSQAPTTKGTKSRSAKKASTASKENQKTAARKKSAPKQARESATKSKRVRKSQERDEKG